MKGTAENFNHQIRTTNKKYIVTDQKKVSEPFNINKNISNAKSTLMEQENAHGSNNRKTVMFKQTEESVLNRSK